MKSTTQAYEHGLNDGYYGLTYIDPYYTPEELNAYAEGYKKGKTKLSAWRSEKEASDSAAYSPAATAKRAVRAAMEG